MRRSISFTILFFVMLSVLVSCYQSHKKELDLAYTLAESKPDSALAFLNRINQGKLSDKDMAKYALIYYMAQDKSGTKIRYFSKYPMIYKRNFMKIRTFA
jgi:hypothetical protein